MPPTRSSPRAGSVPVGAAVDVGAHSVHLLVAEVHGHRLVPLVDESATLGLGATVDARGELGAEAALNLLETLDGYADLARGHAVRTINVVATDPLRRAADAGAVIAAVRRRLGVEIQVLRSEEEALLALLGVQAGKPVLRDTALVDIGGGSSEILLVRPSGDAIAAGLALGAARLSRTLVSSDPPTNADIEALLAEARTVMAGAPDGAPDDLVAVGGTASSLLRIGPALARRVLTTKRIRESLAILAGASADAIAATYGVKLSRARVLPGGAAILLAVAERYGRDHIRVSPHGIREGLVLAAIHAGPDWRTDLAWLAHGWSR